MTCQHDPLQDGCTMEIQLNWQGSRIVCTKCLRAAFITKHGRIKDADPPEHAATAPETTSTAGCGCPPGGWNPYCRTHITPHLRASQETRPEYVGNPCICVERLALQANPDCPIHGVDAMQETGGDDVPR